MHRLQSLGMHVASMQPMQPASANERRHSSRAQKLHYRLHNGVSRTKDTPTICTSKRNRQATRHQATCHQPACIVCAIPAIVMIWGDHALHTSSSSGAPATTQHWCLPPTGSDTRQPDIVRVGVWHHAVHGWSSSRAPRVAGPRCPSLCSRAPRAAVGHQCSRSVARRSPGVRPPSHDFLQAQKLVAVGA